MDTYQVRQGEAIPIDFTLQDDQGNPITTYTGTESLAASVSPGGNLPASFMPAASWISGPLGTFNVTISAAQTASLPIGRYFGLATLLDPTLGLLEAANFQLDIVAGVGTATPPTAYCGFADLLEFGGSWIRDLQTPDRKAGFADQCGRARSWLDDLIIGSWTTGNALTLGDPGYGAVLSGQGTGQLPSAWLRQQLDANRLIVRDLVKEICSNKALGFICQGQIGPDDKGQQFLVLSRFYRNEANNLARTLRAEVDLNGDGLPEIAVNLGCTNMR